MKLSALILIFATSAAFAQNGAYDKLPPGYGPLPKGVCLANADERLYKDLEHITPASDEFQGFYQRKSGQTVTNDDGTQPFDIEHWVRVSKISDRQNAYNVIISASFVKMKKSSFTQSERYHAREVSCEYSGVMKVTGQTLTYQTPTCKISVATSGSALRINGSGCVKECGGSTGISVATVGSDYAKKSSYYAIRYGQKSCQPELW